jgi:hypothetical protein
MSQLQQTLPPTTAAVPRVPGRRTFITITGAIALAAALIMAALVIGRPSPAGFGASTADVTDGWMHGTSALSVSAARSAKVTDGWASRYLTSASAGEVTDGWAGRYLPSAGAGEVTDGWAGRYLPSAGAGN